MTPTPAVCAGVDGCPAGWIAVTARDIAAPEVIVAPDFAGLVERLGPDATIAVDMPIGLPDRVGRGGRGPEALVRAFLGPRQSSVFSIPPRAAVEAEDYREACRLSLLASDPPKKVSKQAFHLFPKIREIDRLLRERPTLRDRIIECHPEFSFCVLNAMVAMARPKKIRGRVNPDGIAERRRLLAAHGLPADFLGRPPPRGAAADDFIDACVNLLIARRHAAGQTRTWPSPPLYDRHGIAVAIHG